MNVKTSDSGLYLHDTHNVHVLYAALKTVSRARRPGLSVASLCMPATADFETAVSYGRR